MYSQSLYPLILLLTQAGTSPSVGWWWDTLISQGQYKQHSHSHIHTLRVAESALCACVWTVKGSWRIRDRNWSDHDPSMHALLKHDTHRNKNAVSRCNTQRHRIKYLQPELDSFYKFNISIYRDIYQQLDFIETWVRPFWHTVQIFHVSTEVAKF